MYLITFHHTPAMQRLLESREYTVLVGKVGKRGYAVVNRPLRSAVPIAERNVARSVRDYYKGVQFVASVADQLFDHVGVHTHDQVARERLSDVGR